MNKIVGRALLAIAATTSGAALVAGTTGIAAAADASALPPTWHIHDCAQAPCLLPHAAVGFFPAILGQSLTAYLADPGECPDATDKAFLGGGQPPTTDGVEQNQPLREGVCQTSTTVIHLRSVAPDQPAPTGWTEQGTSGGYTTYYLLTSHS